MQRHWLTMAAVVVLAACSGGNPFELDDTTSDGDETSPGVPEDIAGSIESFSYDPTNETLVVRGMDLDATPYQATYTRKPGLDIGDYEAYTSQQNPLTRHTTFFVRDINGTRAGVAMSGQFGHVFGGALYKGKDFSAPDVATAGGLVSYAGDYVGFVNTAGSSEDLLPTAPGTPDDIKPGQVAEITGRVFINADFSDNTVDGRVYNRIIPDATVGSGYEGPLDNIDFEPTSIDKNGNFVGNVTDPSHKDIGTYGGAFGGTDGRAVAGALTATGHITDDTIEFGIFVLDSCNSAAADPVCP